VQLSSQLLPPPPLLLLLLLLLTAMPWVCGKERACDMDK
jgi:hypothetical protein